MKNQASHDNDRVGTVPSAVLCLLGISLTICFAAVLAKGSQKPLTTKSDSELINTLSSVRESTGASDEIVHRGARMIPLLLKVKGDQRPAFAGLGHHLSATPTMVAIDPSKAVPGKTLTMEIAALYLICAIYHDTVEFAQSPYLSDLRLPVRERKALNSPELVARAWESVEEWNKRLAGTTIENLRSSKDDPLKGSGVAFW